MKIKNHLSLFGMILYYTLAMDFKMNKHGNISRSHCMIWHPLSWFVFLWMLLIVILVPDASFKKSFSDAFDWKFRKTNKGE